MKVIHIAPLYLLSLLLSLQLSAADFTWNGSSVVNNNWSSQFNWSQPGSPPLVDTTTALTFSGSTRPNPNAQAAYTINSMLFSGTSTAFTVSGSTITFGGVNPFLRNTSSNNHTISNATSWSNGGAIRAQTADLTFGGQISVLAGTLGFQSDTGRTIQVGVMAGTGGITKSGGGILQNNGLVALSGPVSTSAGTIQLGSGFSVGAYQSFTGSNFKLNGNLASFTELSGSGNIDLTGGTLTVNQSTDTTTSSPISGEAGKLIKTGTGTLSIAGSLNHTGTTTVNGGTLKPTGSFLLSTGSLHDIGGSGILDISGTTQNLRGLTGSGSVITTGGNLIVTVENTTNVWSGSFTGNGQLTKGGSGTFAVTSNLAHSGGTNIEFGTIAISNGGALGTPLSPTTIGFGGALQISSAITVSSAKNISLTGAGPINGGAIRFETLSGTGNASVESQLNLTGNSTITHASLEGTLNLGGTSSPGTITLGSNSLTLNGTGGGDIQIRHALVGSGTLIHNRARNLFLQNASPAFTGPIEVADGAIVLANADALGAGAATAPITVSGGAALELDSNITVSTARPLHLPADAKLISRAKTTWTGSGDIILSGQSPVIETSGASDTLTIAGSGQITGESVNVKFNTSTDSSITINRDITLTGALFSTFEKKGPGTLILAGQADYPGTTLIDGGTVRLAASERLPATTIVSMLSGTLDLNGHTQTVDSIIGSGSLVLGSGKLRLQPAFPSSIFFGEISGAGSLEILGSAGEQRFNTANSFTGPTTIRSGGLLRLGSPDALDPNSSLTIEGSGFLSAATGTMTVTALFGEGRLVLSTSSKLVIDNPAPFTWSGEIAGSGSLEKSGTGRGIFTAAATHSGSTTVNLGILEARGGLPNSAVTVASGGTLYLQGAAAAAEISGALLPGPSSATLGAAEIAGALDVQSGGILFFRIQDWDGSPGSGHDVIDCQVLNFNSTPINSASVVVNLSANLVNFEESPRVFKLVRTTANSINNFIANDTVSVNVNNPSLETPEGTWSFRVFEGDLELVYTPEGTSGYDAWLSGYDLGLLSGPDDDPDNDGISNLIEFIIGGNPENENDSDKLPTSTLDATHLEFVFRRSKASEYLNPVVRHSIDLSDWNIAQHGQNGVTISVASIPLEPDVDLVTVRIPRNNEPRLFAQLFVTLPADP